MSSIGNTLKEKSGIIGAAPVVFSFDVEEHHRIEAAVGVKIPPHLKVHYRQRLVPSTRWILEELARHDAKATFFVLGQIAVHSPRLVREIHRGGHEVASHGWDHRRVSTMTPDEFRADVSKSKDALEQLVGDAVQGYRAPTFSIGRSNPWAVDILAEVGMKYDSSIYPVRHDRYGVPAAPREPFTVSGIRHTLLELPPATWRVFGINAPMGGGGYFRLFPLWCTNQAINQAESSGNPPVAMLYFHPWEFDIEQQRLPLGHLNRFRTYVGIRRSKERLGKLLQRHPSCRAIDVADQLVKRTDSLRHFDLAQDNVSSHELYETLNAVETRA